MATSQNTSDNPAALAELAQTPPPHPPPKSSEAPELRPQATGSRRLFPAVPHLNLSLAAV